MRLFPFFEALSNEAQTLLLSHAKEVKMPKGVELFAQGDQCKEILFLVDGFQYVSTACMRAVKRSLSISWKTVNSVM
ncbi:MAG: hypothetical protein PF439_10035 [Helicobacteraceae bacterium]|jgi:GMP synthase-like glutamine amidotransferase|nr:hypothetical protein [Helicobacteraceae bacterium]